MSLWSWGQWLSLKRRWLRLLAILALAGVLGGWLYRRDRENRFDPLIVAAANRYRIDPALVKAVIWRESRFRANAQGSVGEIGLMQIRDAAAHEWAAAEKKAGFAPRQLFDPDTNIYAGSWYLSDLMKRYRATDDPIPYTLADYNAGRSHVLRWMRGAAKTNSAAFLAQMDFPGTRSYIASVHERYKTYALRLHAAKN
jgi:soluble lytic murein transglycosylase